MDTQRFHRGALYALLYCYAFSLKTYANCYFPNGTDVNALFSSDVYRPCDAGDEDSMCCALNRPDVDKCRSDGLCLSTYDGNVWRDSCTDRSWKSSKCIKLCDTGIGQYHEGKDLQLADVDIPVTHCEDGSYCCGNGTIADSCCDKKNGVFHLNGETTSNNPSGTSSLASKSSISISTTSSLAIASSSLVSPVIDTLASSPTTSPPLNSKPTPNTQTSNSSKNNTGAIVGGVIGGIAILLLIVGMILIFLRRNISSRSEPRIPRSNRRKLWLSRRAESPILNDIPGIDARRELDARQRQELDTGRDFYEMQ